VQPRPAAWNVPTIVPLKTDQRLSRPSGHDRFVQFHAFRLEACASRLRRPARRGPTVEIAANLTPFVSHSTTDGPTLNDRRVGRRAPSHGADVRTSTSSWRSRGRARAPDPPAPARTDIAEYGQILATLCITRKASLFRGSLGLRLQQMPLLGCGPDRISNSLRERLP